jgi:hypothetical protein
MARTALDSIFSGKGVYLTIKLAKDDVRRVEKFAKIHKGRRAGAARFLLRKGIAVTRSLR